jgi:hypothetical protein
MVAHDTYRVHHQPSLLRALLTNVQLYAVRQRWSPTKERLQFINLAWPDLPSTALAVEIALRHLPLLDTPAVEQKEGFL